MSKLTTPLIGFSLAAILVLPGCAAIGNSDSASVYQSSQAQREQIVRMGTVESVRPVTIDASNGQPGVLGTVGGGALGAIGGSAIGGGRGSIITGILGGIAGVVAGQAIENRASQRPGLEITVRLDNGELRAVTQSADESFRPGDRVRLLTSGGITRVTH
ncbi:membrane protein [Pandoraea thiooxydans]|uniref:Glycine zipper 2TM domain-containing protein n=1 Tax=Pandoraea thiooxydans TaxID=445709 RepID=A0A0G3EVG5_9BURK|nr:membrane protein [Pandoraea thiooxydans]AKJ69994.1 hypothetical protein ABW99_19070 [Pandoraea thiooxydans]APR93401.1 membrane protein [Pandoraea thiooxydans]